MKIFAPPPPPLEGEGQGGGATVHIPQDTVDDLRIVTSNFFYFNTRTLHLLFITNSLLSYIYFLNCSCCKLPD